MDTIVCPQCNHQNPVEAAVCEECNTDLRSVKSIVDTANTHFNEALALAHAGNLDEAQGQLDAAIALCSTQPAYFNLLGTIKAQKGLFSEAIHAWEQCLALDPEMEKAYDNIEKARRMEVERAEEFEQRPQWITNIIAVTVASLCLVATVVLGVNSFSKSKQISQLTDDLITKEKEASMWKSQFESITAQFPTEGINGVLKKITETETLLADRDKKISELEQKLERASTNYRERLDSYRENLKKNQQEKNDLTARLKTIDQLKAVIVENETQIDTLQSTITVLQNQLTEANERIESYKTKLLNAQNSLQQLRQDRTSAIENAQKLHQQAEQKLRDQILELRDEVARGERKIADWKYADTLVLDALQHLENNDFSLARQNIETAWERSPDHPVALYMRDFIDRILDDPLEQEIRRWEKRERDSKREEIKSQLIVEYYNQAQKMYRLGHYDQAIDLAQRTLRLKPDNPKDVNAFRDIIDQSEERKKEIVLLLDSAKRDIENQKLKDAESKINKILKISSQNSEALHLRQQLSTR